MGKSWAVYCLIRYISYMMIWSFYLLLFVMIWSFYWLSFVIWFDLFQCRISGKPSPAVKWVLNGRIISNLSSPPHASRWLQLFLAWSSRKFKPPGGTHFKAKNFKGSSSIQVACKLLLKFFDEILSLFLTPPYNAFIMPPAPWRGSTASGRSQLLQVIL